MRLIRCYIENFGGLSRYTLDFSPGLTALNEPNGFGKTTLAEFIRAMFYGFPRAAKSLEKNTRKKYLPWQGGKYGGYLIFEQDGRQYKIERRFGATPKSDTFALYDMQTNRLSDRYSENIGLELFQLDGDSYVRSTYLPQTHENLELSTDGIRAKLGNLVEDTNDVNRFEKAIEQLRTKRSMIDPYRGPGGQIEHAQLRISEIQQQLRELEAVPRELEQEQSRKEQLENTRQQAERELVQLRQSIKCAAERTMRQEHANRYRQMQQEQTRIQSCCDGFLQDYPGGVPEEEELETLSPVLQNALSLQKELEDMQPPRQEQQFLEENRRRFASGVPAEGQLTECARRCTAYVQTQSTCRSAVLQPQETQQLEQLESFFHGGVPTAEELEKLGETEKQIGILEGQKQQLGLTVGQQEKLRELKEMFASGVPGQVEIETQRRHVAKLCSLQEQQSRQTAAEPVKKQSPIPFACCLTLGVMGAAVGAVLMLRKAYAAGGAALGIGVVLLIAAVYLRLKQMLLNQKSPAAGPLPADLPQQIQELREDVLRFLGKYSPAYTPGYESLADLAAKADAYRQLLEQEENRRRSLTEIEDQQARLRQQLLERYCRYFGDELPERPLETLRNAAARHETLSRRSLQLQQMREQLQGQLQEQEQVLTAFLQPYFDELRPEQFSEQLSQLRRDCDRYEAARQTAEAYDRNRMEKSRLLEQAQARLEGFAEKYGLEIGNSRQLQYIRDQIRDWKQQQTQLSTLREEIRNFAEAYPEVLLDREETEIPELAELEQQEKRKQGEKNEILREITVAEQRIRTLRQQAEQLPELQDEMEQWIEKKQTARKNRDLLDETISYLQKAREQLARQYLGGVQNYFSKYLQLLTEEKTENVFVDTDLGVQVERCGEARTLGYLSAGQSDLIMLCMRFALVDALYENTSPLMILDDPFVNLDDAHTEKAVRLLQTLSKDHQILYLVCNSSRQA